VQGGLYEPKLECHIGRNEPGEAEAYIGLGNPPF
jgi:hypothetical protein